MFDIIRNSGLFGYAICLIGIACFVLTYKTYLIIGQGEESNFDTKRRSLLFWGATTVVLGLIGHTVGMYSALRVMGDMTKFTGSEVASTLRISLGPVVLSFGVLSIVAVSWMSLGVIQKRKKLTA